MAVEERKRSLRGFRARSTRPLTIARFCNNPNEFQAREETPRWLGRGDSYDLPVARFGEHAAWFAFTSDRFDHASELPEEANAGNQF